MKSSKASRSSSTVRKQNQSCYLLLMSVPSSAIIENKQLTGLWSWPPKHFNWRLYWPKNYFTAVFTVPNFLLCFFQHQNPKLSSFSSFPFIFHFVTLFVSLEFCHVTINISMNFRRFDPVLTFFFAFFLFFFLHFFAFFYVLTVWVNNFLFLKIIAIFGNLLKLSWK